MDKTVNIQTGFGNFAVAKRSTFDIGSDQVRTMQFTVIKNHSFEIGILQVGLG